MRRKLMVGVAWGLIWALMLPVAGQAQEPARPVSVTPPAIWHATDAQLAAIREKCPVKWLQTLVDCFVEAMEADGAPPEAVALVKALGKDERYLTNLRTIGPVDVADIQRPNRGPGRGEALVNGNPPVIDVNSPEVLQWIGQDAMARGLIPENPELAIHPMSWYLRNFPIVHAVAGVGQDFTEGYTLSQGCAWCGVNAVFARFRFDGAGNFLGVSVQNVARDEDTEIPEPDPDDGMARRRTLRYKVGDVVQFKLRFAGDTWKLMDPVDAAVLRTVEAGPWGGIFCAGVCFGVESWIFEATGPGEVRLVFKNAPPKGAVVPPEMTVEYLIEVE